MKPLRQVFLSSLLVLAVLPSARGFSLLGPFKTIANGYVDDWQIPRHGYNINGAIGGTMEPMEGYRWNMPIVTYAYDRSFFAYFGSNGVNAVESAIAILNNLPQASQITNDSGRLYIGGQPVPFDTKRVNYRAEVLGMVDVKSTAMRILLEEMGLAEPERWCFAIRNRMVIAGTSFFAVRKQNFDPITLSPTNRVNEATYSYFAYDFDPAMPVSDAEEFAVDGLAVNYSAVAGFTVVNVLFPPSPFGVFFDGLSHDDVGGLRWLLNPNNLAVEVLPPGTMQTSAAVAGGGGSTRGGGSPWSPAVISTNVIAGTSPWTPVFNPTNIPGTTNVPTTPVITNDLSTVPFVRPGVNKVFFQRVIFDNLLGNTFSPVTVRWTDRFFANGRINSQGVARVVTQPDIVFSAGDTGIGVLFPTVFSRTTTDGWTNMATLNGGSAGSLGGPGIINPPITIMFNDQWPVFQNFDPGGELENPPGSIFSQSIWLYGSFDGSTNPPVLYPQYGNLTVEDIQAYISQVSRAP
jgi:hypothetical protein